MNTRLREKHLGIFMIRVTLYGCIQSRRPTEIRKR